MTQWCFLGLGLGGSYTSQGIIELRGLIQGRYPGMKVLTFRGERASAMMQMIRDQVKPSDKLIIGGYSWNADNAPAICNGCGRTVDFMFALQPSIWYPAERIGPSVKEALCVYNPWYIETLGLGFRKLELAAGNTRTSFNLVQTHDGHPYVQYDPRYRQMIYDGIDRALR